MKRILVAFCVCLCVTAARADRVGYWAFVAEYGGESFVIETTNAAFAGEIRLVMEGKSSKGWPALQIAPGSRGINAVNLDYNHLSRRVWNWHVVELIALTDISNLRPNPNDPRIGSLPSEISADPETWIAANGDRYSPVVNWKYEFHPAAESYLINESCRGVVGSGDRVLIAGFVIRGDKPQRIVVRGLGSTLARHGVSDPVADPLLVLYRGGVEIGRSDDLPAKPWDTFQGLDPFYWEIEPKDCLLVITLPPGSYTAHLDAKGGPEAIGLVEIYDAEPR